MKKIVLFFMLASLAIFGVACSSDDTNSEDLKQLVIVPDFNQYAAPVGENIGFVPYLENGTDLVRFHNAVTYFVNGIEAALPLVFNSPGDYRVIGKVPGLKDSYPIQVTAVNKENPGPGEVEEGEYLVVKAKGDKVEFKLGDSVYFDVRNQDGLTMLDAELFVSDHVRISNPWRPTRVGTYKVVAEKLGYRASEGLIITVY